MALQEPCTLAMKQDRSQGKTSSNTTMRILTHSCSRVDARPVVSSHPKWPWKSCIRCLDAEDGRVLRELNGRVSALQGIYSSLNSPQQLSGWNTNGDPYCQSGKGVSCFGSLVTSINLASNGLTSNIPYSISSTTGLTNLYGELQGLNKQETTDRFGKEKVHRWCRSYDIPPPNGESLEVCAERDVAYFREQFHAMINTTALLCSRDLVLHHLHNENYQVLVLFA